MEIRRRHLQFLDLGSWAHRELYSEQLITEQFDASIPVAHGLQDIATPLEQAGLQPERLDLRALSMDESMPRIS
eukprot:1427-Pyramimonas_sp.AAC.1